MRRAARAIAGALLLIVAISFSANTPAAAGTGYAPQILADAPDVYWRLNENNGASSFSDATGNGNTGASSGYLTTATGAILQDSNRAMTFYFGNNTVVTPNQYSSLTYTEEVWFQTNTTQGGALMGFREAGQAGRNVWLNDAGNVVMQTSDATGSPQAVTPGTYNDNKWHLVTAVQTPTLMTLYVDGQSKATKALSGAWATTVKWSIGPGDVSMFANHPTTAQINGQQDEGALWSTRALSDWEINRHFALGRGGYSSGAASVVVDPALSFSTGPGATCNGVVPSSGASSAADSVQLGHSTPGTVTYGTQALMLSTNAASGATVYLATTGPLASGGAQIADAPGTNAAPASLPAAGVEAWGYTSGDATLSTTTGATDRFVSGGTKWARFSSTPGEVFFVNTPASNLTSCIGFGVGTSTATAAGQYVTTVVYTVVPLF